MAEAGQMRFVGDEPGREWHDWNCQLAPRAATPKGRGRRHRRFNPHHDPESGQFTHGHGIGGARPRDGSGGMGVQPYAHQVNDPTPHGTSTAEGHPIKGEVPGVLNYSLVSGPEVFGVKVPALTDSQRARIDARIDRATTPPKSHPRPEKWNGRDEERVFDHALNLHDRIGEMHGHVARADGDALSEALHDRNQGAGNALALAYAREVMPRIDAKVKSGELVRTFEDAHSYATTRLRRAHPATPPNPPAEVHP